MPINKSDEQYQQGPDEMKGQREQNNACDKVGGWKRLSTKKVYENPWIRVSHETVKTPNDTDGIYGVVHFKHTAVGILPIDTQGNTWLVRQSRYALNQYTWEIPEGGAQEDELPIECAKRELQEEVGLRAQHWQELMQLHLSNSVTDELGVIFIAKNLSVCEARLEDTEDIETLKLPFAEALSMVLKGEITDAISVAAILRYELLRDQ